MTRDVVKGYGSGADAWVNARRRVVEPVLTLQPSHGGGHKGVETHPAYAMIGAARVSGNTVLFGSEFRHTHYMTITICRAERHRDTSTDWYFGREELIEVALSEAGWATFLSAPNNGHGVPCTLQVVRDGDLQPVPSLPTPAPSMDSYKDDVANNMKEARELLTTLRERIVSGKGGKESLSLVDRALMEIGVNQDFVAKQFVEHMEGIVEKAKIEVAAWSQNYIRRAGLAAIAEKGPLALPEGDGG